MASRRAVARIGVSTMIGTSGRSLAARRAVEPDDVQQTIAAAFTVPTICRAAAKVSAEWLGVGVVHSGLPFDMNEFLRLCAEEAR